MSLATSSARVVSIAKERAGNPHTKKKSIQKKKKKRVCVHKESTVYIELPKLISKSEVRREASAKSWSFNLCNRATVSRVLVQHERIVFDRSSFGSFAHSFGCTSPIYPLCVCVSFDHHFHILRSTCFCFVVIVVLYLPLHILVSDCSNFACHFPNLSSS